MVWLFLSHRNLDLYYSKVESLMLQALCDDYLQGREMNVAQWIFVLYMMKSFLERL